MAAAASNVVDSFITEDEVVGEVAHGLVEVPYHLAVVVTKLSKARRMMWVKTTTKTSALASSDRSGPLKALSPALPLARPEEQHDPRCYPAIWWLLLEPELLLRTSCPCRLPPKWLV